MKKSTIAKTLAIASLVGCGVTACTSNPFSAKSVDNNAMTKTTEAGCGGSCGGKHTEGSCGAGKKADAKCGEGKCGGNH